MNRNCTIAEGVVCFHEARAGQLPSGLCSVLISMNVLNDILIFHLKAQKSKANLEHTLMSREMNEDVIIPNNVHRVPHTSYKRTQLPCKVVLYYFHNC